MTEWTIPSDWLDYDPLEGGGFDDVFPEGVFEGTLETPSEGVDRLRTPPWDENEKRLTLRLGEITPVDAAVDSVGNRKFFADLTVEAGGDDINKPFVPRDQDTTHPGVRVAQRRLIELARAWQLTGNGTGPQQFDLDALVQGIAEGTFDGQRIRFRVYHKRSGDRTFANIGGFAAAH